MPLRSLTPQTRQKRSSLTTFFAFSSKKRSSHLQLPASSQLRPISPSAIPSPLRADEEEYYYSYYTSMSHPSTPNPGASPSKQLSVQHTDLDSPPASPHSHLRHPYAYSTPLHPHPRLRHVSSQPLQHHPHGSSPGPNTGQHEPSQSHPSQAELKTSMSTPNLISGAPVRSRSILRKRPPSRQKGQDRWLSAETWWDALFSPSPRFKVKRAPRPRPDTDETLVNKPEPNGNLSVTFPSVSDARPRAVSVTSNRKPIVPSLVRSRSAVDLSGRPPTSATARAGFEPALETLVDQPTPPPEQPPGNDTELPLPDAPLSLEQVLTEGEALDQQRAQWKHQAYKSIGNKHTRSFSRARSKSLGERHARFGHQASEGSKAQFNLEFLAARTLLGSQSTMPVVHVTKPGSSSSHSKAYSHSYSHSAHSYTHTHSSHSRVYSHSHSHSLTTSNSSKSSRHFSPRAHSRNGSWSKTALLKAGALCGIASDDSVATHEKVPSSSRVDVQGTILIGNAGQTSADVDKISPPPSDPCGEVGIAISSLPALEGLFDPGSPDREADRESHWSSKHTHKSSEYAGPHPSAIDSNLPPLGAASGVSLRHRLPPRPAIHPPIAPIAHPYRSVTVQSGQVVDKGATSKITKGVEPGAAREHYLSLNNTDFEQYGVGEALVYASRPRPEDIPKTKQAEVQSESLPPSPQEVSPSTESAPQCSSPSAVNSVPSLTNSTIQMVMSAFDDPNDFDEFQDLFYKPQRREASVTTNQVPTDVHSSTSNSPLTHLVRKLSQEVHSLRDPSRTPSDPILVQRNDSQEHRLNETGAKYVFMDVNRSSSPPPMASSSQLQLPIQEGSESTAQSATAIPEDVHSFYTSSVLESPSDDHENDTFGYPIKHGRLEATLAPSPIQSPMRTSTHLSIQEDEVEEDEMAYLSPVTKRSGLASIDAVRASYVTTSDLSRMSGLSDFPLPPGARPVSVLHAYDEATSLSTSPSYGPSEEGTEMGRGDRHTDEEDGEVSGDVKETLRALRTTTRITSYESRRSTFGGSDDMDFITQVHREGPRT